MVDLLVKGYGQSANWVQAGSGHVDTSFERDLEAMGSLQ